LRTTDPALAGKKLRCPKCGAVTVVPATADEDIQVEPSKPAPRKPKLSSAGPATRKPVKKGLDVVSIAVLVVIVGYLGALGAAYFGYLGYQPTDKLNRSDVVVQPKGGIPQAVPPQKLGQQDPRRKQPPTATGTNLTPPDPAEEARLATERDQRRQTLAAAEQPIAQALSQSDAGRAAEGEGTALLKQHQRPVSQLVFSPNSQYLASSSWDGAIKIWDLKTGLVKHDLPAGGNQVAYLAFSPDSQLLAVASANQPIRVFPVQTGQLKQQFAPMALSWTGVAFSPEGKWLFACGPDLYRFDAKTGMPSPYPQSNAMTGASPVVRPDGKMLAVAAAGQVGLWDLEGGKRYNVALPASRWTSLAFSPDGWSLAALDRSPTHPSLVLHQLAKRGADRPNLNAAGILSVAFSPDGKCLALGGAGEDLSHNKVQLWDIAANRERNHIESDKLGLVQSVAFSQGGTLLATGDSNGAIRIWKVTEQGIEGAKQPVPAGNEKR
jgi:WD40 repeat protein